MYIADSTIRAKLKNVYFIWGRGKTTIANELRRKHGFYIYDVDDSRNRHWRNAIPEDQPYMCRNYEKEYGVKSFWELPAEVVADREKHFIEEVTPMIIVDLIELSAKYDVIICEGDIDYEAVAAVATNMVFLQNCGTKFDWFNRSDHENIFETVVKRSDLSDDEKAAIIENAYNIVSGDGSILPEWVKRLNIKCIAWDDNTSVEKTTYDVEEYFGFRDEEGSVIYE